MDLLSILFPKRCVGCGEIGSYLCPDCVNFFVPLQELYCPNCRKPSPLGMTHQTCKKTCGLDGVISVYSYSGTMRKAISKFKYSFVSDLTTTLIELMISGFNHPILFKHQFTIVPVPLHPSRLLWRGFNQSDLLAQGLSKAWSLPYTTFLIRTKKTQVQMELNREKRQKNMLHAFAVTKPIPNSILLIDDVATTCATLNECAKTLKQAGAKQVWGLTLAQKIPL